MEKARKTAYALHIFALIDEAEKECVAKIRAVDDLEQRADVALGMEMLKKELAERIKKYAID